MADMGLLSLDQDWTAEYRGLEIGAPGSPLAFLAIDGLLDAPAVRTADRVALGRHGDVAGTDWLGARTVTLTIEVAGRDGVEFSAAVEDVMRAFTPALPDADFTFRFPGVAGGGLRTVRGRVRARTAPIDVAYSNYLATVVVQLYCARPYIRDASEWQVSATLPNPFATGSGITPPITPPLTFGPRVSGNLLTAQNPGTFDVFPTIRIDGPVSSPSITDTSTGESVTFDITLAAGEWIDVDAETHTVLLNGTAPRFVVPGSSHVWPVIRRGSGSRFAYTGFRLDPGPAGDGSRLALTWRPAWV